MSTDTGPADLLSDWIAIWKSEVTALALDPEWRAAGGQVAALWAALAGTVGDGIVARPAGSGPAPRAAAFGGAPDVGSGGADGDLERRVSELERQLAELRPNLRER